MQYSLTVLRPFLWDSKDLYAVTRVAQGTNSARDYRLPEWVAPIEPVSALLSVTSTAI